MWVQAGIDLSLQVDASFTYYMPPGDREVHLEFVVGIVDPSSILYANEQRALRIIGDPPAGTFAITDEIQLEAGKTYLVTHRMNLVNWGGSPDLLSTGEGHINWTIRPLPEPSGACFVACGLALVLGKRRARVSLN